MSTGSSPSSAYDLSLGAGLQNTSHSEINRLRRIEGRHNALLKEIRQAFNTGELTASGECAVEGFRIIEEAIRSGLKIRAVLVSESGKERAARLLPQIASYVETALVPDKLFASSVPSQTPQGVAALVLIKPHTLNDVIESSATGPIVVVAGIQDPGNLGTILRSSEAFGTKGILLGKGTVSPFNNKVVRASAGSVFRVPTAMGIDLKATIPLLRARNIRSVATSSHKGAPVSEANLSGDVAIFVGNEGSGVEKRLWSEMDELIMIPHSSRVESLNVGIAASIILYEAAEQRVQLTDRSSSE
jgi:TrmH family RNA methyltransferase